MPQLRQCLGVDLGFNTVKIVELAIDKNSVRVIRAASAPTGATPSMSADESRNCIASAARDLIKKARFGSRQAVFSISGQKVFIRRFRLPATNEERLARIIQYEARQQIPFPLDKTILQYQYRQLPEENEVEVLLVALRIDEVRGFMQVAQRTGLTPTCVGVSSFALFSAHQFISLDEKGAAQLFESLSKKKKKGGGFALGRKKGASAPEEAAEEAAPEDETFSYEEVKGYVNLGATSYDLAIGKASKGGGMIGFTRTVPMGGDEMTKAIMKQCNVESFYDAERIKTSSTQLLSFAFDAEEDSQINQDASQAITDVADKMVSEIRRSLDFYITQPDGMAIDSLVLSGGQALLPGMDSYLEEKLTVPVTIIKEPPEKSALQWPASAGPITPFMIAIGLGLQGLNVSTIKVDFLPEERKIVRDFPYRVTAVMIIILAALIGFSTQAGKGYAVKYRTMKDSILAEATRYQGQAKQFEETQALHDQVAEEYVALNKSFGQRRFWMDVLAKISEIKPPEVLIEDIQLEHDGRVTIIGSSELQVSAADLVDGIKAAFGENVDVWPGKEPGNFIDFVVPRTPTAGGSSTQSSQFGITFLLKEKVNHLKITPTPAPSPTGGAAGFNPGFRPGGNPAFPGGGRPSRRGQ